MDKDTFIPDTNRGVQMPRGAERFGLNWICLTMTHSSKYISRPTWVDVSYSCFQLLELIKPDHIVQVKGLIEFHTLHQFRDD